MADTSVAITAGSGTSIDTRTEATNGNHRQVIVVGDPSTNAGVAPVDATAGLKVDLGADNDVTVTSIAAGNNNIGDVDVASIAAGDNNIGNVDVVTLPALPAGTNNIGDVDVLTVNGVAPAFGSGVRGATVQRVTIATDDVVPVTDNSGTLTVDAPVGTPVFVRLSDGSSAIATLPVSLATNTPVGNVAHDAADSGAPIKVGGRARSTEIAAVASDDRADFVTDLVGKQIILPYANPENFVSGAITSAMTGTTSTSLVAAPGAGLRNYITTIIVSNAHATVGTDIIIQDGSGGTTLLTIPAAAVYGGAVINLPVPLRQPTTNTAIFCANVTTGASTKVSAVGYKGV